MVMKNTATLKTENTGTAVSPEVTATVTPVLDTTKVSGKSPGRPVVEGSKRQQELLTKELRRQAGGLKKGRPVNPNSPRQLREAEKAAKRAAGELKPGRPKYTAEEKAIADAAKAERKRLEAERIKEAAAKLIETGKAEEILSTATPTE